MWLSVKSGIKMLDGDVSNGLLLNRPIYYSLLYTSRYLPQSKTVQV